MSRCGNFRIQFSDNTVDIVYFLRSFADSCLDSNISGLFCIHYLAVHIKSSFHLEKKTTDLMLRVEHSYFELGKGNRSWKFVSIFVSWNVVKSENEQKQGVSVETKRRESKCENALKNSSQLPSLLLIFPNNNSVKMSAVIAL